MGLIVVTAIPPARVGTAGALASPFRRSRGLLPERVDGSVFLRKHSVGGGVLRLALGLDRAALGGVARSHFSQLGGVGGVEMRYVLLLPAPQGGAVAGKLSIARLDNLKGAILAHLIPTFHRSDGVHHAITCNMRSTSSTGGIVWGQSHSTRSQKPGSTCA